MNENNQDSNSNENKENGDIDMLVDPMVSQFLQDLDVSNDNDNENEDKNDNENENGLENINNENVVNDDINVNNNGQLQSDKKNRDSERYFCLNCVMYVDDKQAHNAIYHPKSNK